MIKEMNRLTKRAADDRLGQLLNEANIELCPHLRNAYDADELPLAFIPESGAAHAGQRASGMLCSQTILSSERARKGQKG